jgi:sugar phosphate isomerase/epimerase
MGIRFFVNTWIFGNCAIEEVIDRVRSLGYDGIELVGEPKLFPPSRVKPLLDDAGLAVTSICGMHPGPEPGGLRYLGHRDSRERQNAVDYVKACVDMAVGVDAPSVLVVPGQVGSPTYSTSKEVDWRWCVESLAEAGEYAQENGIYLTIEPINRYEVGLVHSIEDALNMAKHVDNPYVAIMGDTFHMQIEESDGIPNAIRRAGGKWLRHMHAADNTREAPGMGTMPWREVLRALYDIGYQGGLSLEPLPKGASPYDARDGLIPREVLDSALAKALSFLRREDEIVRGF